MNRTMLEQHLKEARGHVALGERRVARQKAIIRSLERDGHNSAVARELLCTFEQTQKMHVDDVSRIEGELAILGRTASRQGLSSSRDR